MAWKIELEDMQPEIQGLKGKKINNRSNLLNIW